MQAQYTNRDMESIWSNQNPLKKKHAKINNKEEIQQNKLKDPK